MSDVDPIERLVETASAAELVDAVDDWCATGRWDDLLRLWRRLDQAGRTVRQLGPVAAHTAHRLTLAAPPAVVATVLAQATGRPSVGPLTEVAASVHDWAALEGHLTGPTRTLVAYERVVRGEDLRGALDVDRTLFDLPLVLQPWEPRVDGAVYDPLGGRFPAPESPEFGDPVACDPDARPIGDEEAIDGLLDVVRMWSEESNGSVDAVAVDGDQRAAVGALGEPVASFALLDTPAALEQLCWAGASGGAAGPRRGAAAGRFAAWWAVAAITGRTDEWPLDPDDVGAEADRLVWYAWATGRTTPWTCRLVAVDADRGRSFALVAVDDRLSGP